MNKGEYQRMYEVEDSHWWYVALHDLITGFVAGEGRGRRLRILDAGCGTGRLCQLLLPYGDVEGCDISEQALACSRERGIEHLSHADLNCADLGENRYDLITSIDVLYHRAVTDDAAVLARFFRALRPGGLLILNLVAHEFLRSTHDIAVHTRKRYTRSEMVHLLTREGFVVEKATYRLGFLFVPIASYRFAKRFLTGQQPAERIASDVDLPSRLVNGLLLRMALMENRILRHWSVPMGTSVFVLARKPEAG